MSRPTRGSPESVRAERRANVAGPKHGELSAASLPPRIAASDRSAYHNLSPAARRRLLALGLDRDVPAVELRAGRIVASILEPCRVHLYADGRTFIELVRRLPGSPERMAHHVGGACLARAVAAGGGR